MAALDRAFALAEMDRIAVGVGDDLDFDMTRRGDVFLDEDAAVAESGLRFTRREAEAFAQLGIAAGMRMPLPPPPAAALIITG